MSSTPAPELHPDRLLPADPGVRAIARRLAEGCAATLAAWVLPLDGHGAPAKNTAAEADRRAADSGDLATEVPAVLDTVEPGSGRDHELVAVVLRRTDALQPSA